MSERKTIIRTVGLKKHYTVGGNTVRALDGVDMSVLQGEFVCVAGRSGSGKSTMLNMLAGLEPPTEGEIIVRGKHHLEAMDEEQRTRFRRRYIGFVFQTTIICPSIRHWRMWHCRWPSGAYRRMNGIGWRGRP